MNLVNEAVTRINELNEKYDYFIEPIKREELYEFIDSVARIASLKRIKDENIQKKNDEEVNKRDEGFIGIGMAISIVICVVSYLVGKNYDVSWGLRVAIVVHIVLIIYFRKKGKINTIIGISVSFGIESLVFINWTFVWLMSNL